MTSQLGKGSLVPSHGFDVLRLVAATLVIYGHAFPLTGAVSPGFLGNSIQTIGVKIFFVISGFLITKSWLASRSLSDYMLKRVLRIWPGLAVTILLTAFVLGPLLTSLALSDYFLSSSPWRYLRNTLLYPVYDLRGVFEHNVYPNAVNGSLWSLPVEVSMYIAVPLILWKRQRDSVLPIVIAAVALVLLGLSYVRVAPPAAPLVMYGTSLLSMLDVACYFMVGGVCSFAKVDIFRRHWLLFAALLLVGQLIGHPVIAEIYLAVVLPLFVIGFGLLRLAWWGRITRGNDYSYGMYLYGFPVQQWLLFANPGGRAEENFIWSMPVVLLFAVASWHGVERPALRFKRYLSDKGNSI